MTNTKMTNKKALNYIIDTYAEELPADVVEKLNGMVVQLDKRSGAERKPSARQAENSVLKDAIVAEMAENTLYTITQMIKEFECIPSDTSTQRISALLSQLVAEGKVERTVEKRKTYFSLA